MEALKQYPGYTPFYRVTVPDDWSFDFTRVRTLRSYWEWAHPSNRLSMKQDHPARRFRPLVVENQDCIVIIMPDNPS